MKTTFDRGEQPKNLEWQRQKSVEGASSSVLTTVWTMVVGQVFNSSQTVCEEVKGDRRETGEKRREAQRDKSESRIVKMYTLLKVDNRKEVVEGSCLQSAVASVARATQ